MRKSDTVMNVHYWWGNSDGHWDWEWINVSCLTQGWLWVCAQDYMQYLWLVIVTSKDEVCHHLQWTCVRLHHLEELCSPAVESGLALWLVTSKMWKKKNDLLGLLSPDLKRPGSFCFLLLGSQMPWKKSHYSSCCEEAQDSCLENGA